MVPFGVKIIAANSDGKRKKDLGVRFRAILRSRVRCTDR